MDLLVLLTDFLLLVIALRLVFTAEDVMEILKILRAIHLEQIRRRK